MSYTITPSPLGGTERLLVTQDPRGMTLAASLQARPVRAHKGFFLASRRAAVWTCLYENGVIAKRHCYGWVYKHEYKNYATLTDVMKRLRRSKESTQ